MADDLARRALLQCGAACALASACGKFVDSPVAIEAGAPVRNLLSVPLSRMPELTRNGGSIILHADARDATGRRLSLLVANTTSQGLVAYDAYCPHAACEVAWVDPEDSVVCPCHFSRFSVAGTVTHGPANADLDTYPAKLSGDGRTLIVDLGGSPGVFPAASNGEVVFTVQQLPVLAQAGGSVTGRAAGVAYPIVVLRASATQMIACDARCTHLGCAVQGAQTLFICPCHGSLFGLNGAVKSAPATQPLRTLEVTFDGTTVRVKVPA